ncbi:hypothetical protein TNCV_754471, partial [Trichonephila clavipes]
MPKLWLWRYVVSPSIVKKSNLSQDLAIFLPSTKYEVFLVQNIDELQ